MAEYHPEARDEPLAAARLYADETPRLAREFRDAIRTAESLIEEKPQRWPRYAVPGTQNGTQNVRRYVLRRFPFLMVYSVEKNGILILAIAHQSRAPEY